MSNPIKPILISLLVGLYFGAPVLASDAITKIKDYFTKNKISQNMQMANDLESLINNLSKSLNGRPFEYTQWSGFSGVGINKSEVFAYSNMVIDHIKVAQSQTPEAVQVIIAGGTVDGIGMLDEVIRSAQARRKIKPVVYVGMMSAAGAGYPSQISRHHDHLMVMDTFVGPDGKMSWELKKSPHGMSMTAQIHKALLSLENCLGGTQEYFEGGEVALRESAEILALASSRDFPRSKFRLVLHPGVNPAAVANPAKDKGFRAATILAHILHESPGLIPQGLSLLIEPNHQAPDRWRTGDFKAKYSLEEYFTQKHDDIDPRINLEEGHFEQQVREAERIIVEAKSQLGSAANWSKNRPVSQGYYGSRQYFQGLIRYYEARILFMQSWLRFQKRYPEGKNIFLSAMKSCEASLSSNDLH
ncbi:MAG: hypothetical protein AB1540_15030 [Bdellovibrionota bacterium]